MKFAVVKGIGRLPVLEKIAKMREVILQSTGNTNFPTPTPTLATLATIANQTEAAYLQGKTGGADDKANTRTKVALLELAFSQYGSYVEGVANTNLSTAEAVILSAGFRVKGRKTRKVQSFGAGPTGNPGEVRLTHQGVVRGAIEFQMSTDISSDVNWRTISLGTRGRIVKGDLATNTRYYFRCRVITKDGPGEWSEVRVVYLVA